MEYKKLGSSGLKVSEVCLGTMTWGEQNSEAEGHEQMDYAAERGVNFFDTAELYSIPIHPDTYGATEKVIGTWFEARKNRSDIILASKIAGPSRPWIREGSPMTGASVKEAIEGSLKRLRTDYIDVYQLHWPNRPFPHFGRNLAGLIDFTSNKTSKIIDNMLDVLKALDDAVKDGKIRYAGLSNESAWGISKYAELAKEHNLPVMTSIQNEFSLLNRSDDPYVAETCVREDVAYLPWSPLTRGMLSGKYEGGKTIPAGTRWERQIEIDPDFKEFRDLPQVHAAIDAYIAVAKKHGLDVCQMALAFCKQQSFVTSTIIGATTMEQLKSNIDAFDLTLSDEVMRDIHEVYTQYPVPF